jgi:L-seryl-tRNA(Ser) seleniumtransferase
MPPAVVDAFVAAASLSVPIETLQATASGIIGSLTGTDAALVTGGASAALTLGAAAILTGYDLRRMELLPNTDTFPNEFVVAREQRSGYDHAIRAAGGRLIEVGFNEIVAGAGVRRTEAWEYEAAFGPRTAGILYVLTRDSRPKLPEVVQMAHRHGHPVIVDAAAELPPRENLTEIPASGADLVAFSGGKAIRGPQSTGILCGSADLIAAAALQMLDMDDHPELWDPPSSFIDRRKFLGVPRHGIGRGFKVSKEEIIALLTALRLFASGAYEAEAAHYQDWLFAIGQSLDPRHASCRVVHDGDPETFPQLEIQLEENRLGKTAFAICRNLRAGDPPIYVGHAGLAEGKLLIHPLCLDKDKVKVLIRRLKEEIR